MTKRYDTTGRPLTATDWAAIRNIPAFVSQLGAAADPGNGLWLVEYNGTTDSFTFTSSSALTVTAPNVSYTSTGSQWTATDVQQALHDLEAAVDHVQGTVPVSSGTFTCTWPTGFASAPGTTVTFYKVGNMVTLTFPSGALGTSDGGGVGFTMGSLPAALTPAHEKTVMVAGVVIGTTPGNSNAGVAKIKTNNTIEFAALQSDSSSRLIIQISAGSLGVQNGLTSLASITYTTN